jgi:hypothetical protein
MSKASYVKLRAGKWTQLLYGLSQLYPPNNNGVIVNIEEPGDYYDKVVEADKEIYKKEMEKRKYRRIIL